MNNYRKESLINKLQNINWLEVELEEDVNVACSNFKGKITTVLDELAPVTQVRLKQRSGDWFNAEILQLISKRDKALVKFKKSKKTEDYSEYKRLRKLTQRTISKSKEE